MPQPQPSLQTALQMKRTFSAPREQVFRAWTDAHELARWFAPTDDYTVVVALDFRVGGNYRLEMRHKNGNVHPVTGTYREIQVPEKLVYTWRWEDDAQAGETLVTVEFRAIGDATEIVLTHELFPSMEQRDKHTQGWAGCFERLVKIL